MFSCIIAFTTVFREINRKDEADVIFYISPTTYSEKAWTVVHRERLKMILKRREKAD